MAARAVVPRNIRLMDELEKGEKGQLAEACSLGFEDTDEVETGGLFLPDWKATIIGPPHSAHENRIYSLRLHCGASYPDTPPTVRFETKINLPCVDQRTGKVDPSRLPCLSQWKRDNTMETILIELRRYMALPQHKKLPQPPEGFALYRALLRQASQAPLDELQRESLQRFIRSRFYQNAKIQSPRQIVAALEIGYESLQTLKDAAPGQAQALQRLSAFLRKFHIPATHPSRSTPSATRGNAEATKPKQHASGPVVWARPEVPSVLSRPFPSVTGKRHIPKLAHTTGIPFLRLTKPQSPFLSRIIRDKHELRQKRYDRMYALQEHIGLAETEDEWDKLLVRMHGIQEDNSNGGDWWSNGGNFWTTVPQDALHDVQQELKADYEKTNKLSVKMFEIVEKETALAKEELERSRHKAVRTKALRSQTP